MLAFLPEDEAYVILRVPYPLGFYSRGMDGRIDDPNAGWKGRGVWADYGTNAVWHTEGGKGTQGNLVKFQIPPHPLAHSGAPAPLGRGFFQSPATRGRDSLNRNERGNRYRRNHGA